jgi:hypothetical protein
MIIFLTSLFFIGAYCLYYNTHSDGLIELKYDDLYHYQRKEKAYVVYFITLDFFPINIDQIFINRVKKIVEKFKVCKLEKTIYDNKLKYTSKTENILIEALTLKGIIPKNNIELILKTHQSDHLISFILDKKNKQIKICFNHGVLDGIRFVELALFFSNKARIQQFNFPMNTIFKTLLSLGKLACNNSILSKTGNLNLDTDDGVIYSFIIKKKEIDEIRNIHKTSFMGAYQSIILNKIADYVDKLLIVTTVAISNPCQYNSIGGIPYYIDLSTEKENLSKIIDHKLLQNSHFVMITTSEIIKKLLKSKKKNISILFSSIPISKNDVFVGDSIIKGFDTYIPHHTSPVYVFSGKVGENIFVNMGVKNKGLIQYLEKYNWKKI